MGTVMGTQALTEYVNFDGAHVENMETLKMYWNDRTLTSVSKEF